MMRVVVGERGAGKTTVLIDRLLLDPRPWVLVPYHERQVQVRMAIEDRARHLGLQDEADVKSAQRRVLCAQDLDGLRGRRIPAFLIDDVETLLGGILRVSVETVTMTGAANSVTHLGGTVA